MGVKVTDREEATALASRLSASAESGPSAADHSVGVEAREALETLARIEDGPATYRPGYGKIKAALDRLDELEKTRQRMAKFWVSVLRLASESAAREALDEAIAVVRAEMQEFSESLVAQLEALRDHKAVEDAT